jgi:hypothetical protein
MLAFSFARTERAHSFKVLKNLRLDPRDAGGIEPKALQPLQQQVGRSRPLAGERANVPATDADVVRYALYLGRAAASEIGHCPAPPPPVSPPLCETADKAWSVIDLHRLRHGGLPSEVETPDS